MGQARNPSTQRDHTLCVIRALVPTVAVQPPHVCHRQKDWAVSMGSHMQQVMGMSWAPPHLGAPFLLLQTVHVKKVTIQKMGDDLPPEMTVLGTCFNASLTPRRAQDVFFSNDTDVVTLRGLRIISK